MGLKIRATLLPDNFERCTLEVIDTIEHIGDLISQRDEDGVTYSIAYTVPIGTKWEERAVLWPGLKKFVAMYNEEQEKRHAAVKR